MSKNSVFNFSIYGMRQRGLLEALLLLTITVCTILMIQVRYRKKKKSDIVQKKYLYQLSVISQFKNESINLQEWLIHYISQGVDHFYLIDDDSTDAYQPILKPYQQKQMITLVRSIGRHQQIKNYNYFFKDLVRKQSEWVIVCDLDEFIYAHKDTTIRNYLQSVPDNIGEIMIPWKMFGSNNHIQQPRSVRASFTRRASYDQTEKVEGGNYIKKTHMTLTKYIVRTIALYSFSIHWAMLHRPYKCITSDGKTCKTNGKVEVDEEILRNSHLHCNHYPIQSWNWFQEVKVPRGSACSKKNDKVRNEDYFKRYDKNDQLDDELARRV